MSMFRNTPFLRKILILDAVTCAAMAALLTVGAAPIGRLTAIPADLLLYAGLVLFPVAAFMAVVAARPIPPAAGVRVIVVGNALWVVGSLALLVSGWIAPNLLGIAFVAAQALVVAVLAWLEQAALGRETAAVRTA